MPTAQGPTPGAPPAAGPWSKRDRERLGKVDRFLSRLEGDLSRHRETLRSAGLEIASNADLYELAASTSDDVTIPAPYVLYDNQIRRYYAYAKYSWKTSRGEYWAYDGKCSSLNTACDVGGADGFALRFNRNVVNRGVSATFCPRTDLSSDMPQFGGCASPTNPTDNGSAGVAYRRQDRVFYNLHSDYTMNSGQIVMGIDPIACGVTLQLYSRYGHSWASAGLSSISVSLRSFSLNWTSNSQRWAASSQAGTWKRC